MIVFKCSTMRPSWHKSKSVSPFVWTLSSSPSFLSLHFSSISLTWIWFSFFNKPTKSLSNPVRYGAVWCISFSGPHWNETPAVPGPRYALGFIVYILPVQYCPFKQDLLRPCFLVSYCVAQATTRNVGDQFNLLIWLDSIARVGWSVGVESWRLIDPCVLLPSSSRAQQNLNGNGEQNHVPQFVHLKWL